MDLQPSTTTRLTRPQAAHRSPRRAEQPTWVLHLEHEQSDHPCLDHADPRWNGHRRGSGADQVRKDDRRNRWMSVTEGFERGPTDGVIGRVIGKHTEQLPIAAAQEPPRLDDTQLELRGEPRERTAQRP